MPLSLGLRPNPLPPSFFHLYIPLNHNHTKHIPHILRRHHPVGLLEGKVQSFGNLSSSILQAGLGISRLVLVLLQSPCHLSKNNNIGWLLDLSTACLPHCHPGLTVRFMRCPRKDPPEKRLLVIRCIPPASSHSYLPYPQALYYPQHPPLQPPSSQLPHHHHQQHPATSMYMFLLSSNYRT